LTMKKKKQNTRRCVTIQPESVLVELMKKGRFEPARNMALSQHGGDCKGCADDNQWCFRDAETWLVEEAGKRLGKPEMQAAVWLWAHERMEQNYLCCDKYPGHVRLTFDIPLDEMVRADYHVLRSIACNEPIWHHELRATDNEADPEKAEKEWRKHKQYHNDVNASSEVLEMRKAESWKEVFESELWEDGKFERYAGGERCSWVLGLTPFVTLDQLVNVEFLDSAGDAVVRELGENLTLYGTHNYMTTVHFGHFGVTSINSGSSAREGYLLPKIKREARRGIVTKKFTGERLKWNDPKEELDPDLQKLCPNCGVEGGLTAHFEGLIINTHGGIKVRFLHPRGDNEYLKNDPKIEPDLDVECRHCGKSFFLDEVYEDEDL